MKTVDKYQFNEEQGKFDSGIECFLAYHTVIKKYFTLKRISLNEDPDQALYNYLVKEVSLLKKVTHDNVYRCYKMLKTKNNMYLIYDNIEGETLDRIIREKMSFQNKLFIVKQISSVLSELRKNNLVHMALNLNNIILQSENKIKVINFGQAQQLDGSQTSMTLGEPFKSTLTPFVPPEVYENRIHINSDIFSFGMIIVKIFEGEFDNLNKQARKNSDAQDFSQSKYITRLHQLANRMTIKIPEVRIGIKEFQSTLNSKFQQDQVSLTNKSFKSSKSQNVIGSPRKPQLSKKVSDLQPKNDIAQTNLRDKSVTSNRSGISMKHITSTTEKPQVMNKINEMELLMRKILKKRNFVVVLLKMSEACSLSIYSKTSTSIILSYLLIKKAAVSISQLAKLLKFGKNSEYTIQKRIQQYFFKSNFFARINPLINKQMVSTQQMLQKITSEVTQLDSFSSNSLLMEEVKHQKMNNSYLRNCVFQFLNSLNLEGSTEYCKNYQINEVIGIYLISLLSSFKTYQEAHQALFSESHRSFNDDPLIKSLLELKKETIVEMMEVQLQTSEHKDSDTISLVKSARIIK